MTAARRTVVIGVGHRDRADDGIGPAVADALGQRCDEVVTIVREGDLAVLPLLWDADDDVVIVDALAGAGSLGQLVELDPDDLTAGTGLSTHGLNIADGIELARRLHRLPAQLRVFGVMGQDFGYGPMSSSLRRRVGSLVEELMHELGVAEVQVVAGKDGVRRSADADQSPCSSDPPSDRSGNP
jgi:hydrogenase maturation protease